ncbi:MAG: flavin reductase family protein [Opitutaceae bacterium]|jgi:flavin reductase (DIM6/NTAB) family NADH-FMN oxidoreductase RutF|nr:flavin reductase family protein [Opitutaceae bacterium]
MTVDFSTIEPRSAYAWMASLITPRPIAWVSTLSADGKTNLAPFSFFTGVTSNPPPLLFVPVNDRHGQKKHTVLNIGETREFVVNAVPFALAEKMNACAALLPRGESEFDAFGIAPAPSAVVRPPRVADAPAAFECRLEQIVPVGDGPSGAHIIIGRILSAHVSDAILGPDGKVDPLKLDAIGRLGGESYTRARELFEVARPDRKRPA